MSVNLGETFRSLPTGFLLGVSTSAYQIEGAWNSDGKGESIWDRFAHTPGRVRNGDTGDVACDHYGRWAEDLDLIAAAGLDAYRFSIAWTRILPNGTGAINVAGLDFYDRLVDGCLDRGVEPWPCLYHWDLPQRLADRGGWIERDSVGWFADYAHEVVRRLGDRCSHFVLFNEPSRFTSYGYLLERHPPMLSDPSAYGAALHHVNLATAEGLHAVRAESPAAKIGTVLALDLVVPVSESDADREAAALADVVINWSFVNPITSGGYPAQLQSWVEPHVLPGDQSRLQAQLDWVGVNYYTRLAVAADPTEPGGIVHRPTPGVPLTHSGWEVAPEGMQQVLDATATAFPDTPIYATECGISLDESPGPEGRVDDTERIEFIARHLEEVAAAHGRGIDLRGFFVWTLVDNLEWADGFEQRFGLVHLDRTNLDRTPKKSYAWLQDSIRRFKGE